MLTCPDCGGYRHNKRDGSNRGWCPRCCHNDGTPKPLVLSVQEVLEQRDGEDERADVIAYLRRMPETDGWWQAIERGCHVGAASKEKSK